MSRNNNINQKLSKNSGVGQKISKNSGVNGYNNYGYDNYEMNKDIDIDMDANNVQMMRTTQKYFMRSGNGNNDNNKNTTYNSRYNNNSRTDYTMNSSRQHNK